MQKAIGIFDSGVGGLTVLKEIMAKLPRENMIYLGDTARVPYGIRSAETVTRYSFENTNFLLSQEIKLLVIACNTASAISLDEVKKEYPLPVIGVLEPGARAAVEATRTRKVGVIGTEATIGSGAYGKAIRRLAPDVEVRSLACPLFVSLAEEGWTDNDVAALVAEKYLSSLRDSGIDTLVLGCTHYPLLKSVITKAVGDSIRLIDSATETAKEVAAVLEKLKWAGNGQGQGLRKFYVTDSPSRFEKIGKRILGDDTLSAEQVRVGGI
jgi:glutamate racemase